MKKYLILPVVLALSACGGGGSSTPAGITPVTPAPTVSITLSSPKVSVGGTVKISWTSTNATSCTGTDGFSGTQPSIGSLDFKPTTGGQFKYTLSCTGAGGTGTNTQTLIVPIPVQRTSYLNAKNSNIAPQTLPKDVGIRATEQITAGHQFGDFFQDGTLSMVAFTNNYVPVTDPLYGKAIGHGYFYKKDASGKWVDHTADILKDQTGCITPRKVIVADFNGDGKPDVFVACHAYDQIPVPIGAVQGEHPRMLLSQPDGSYKNIDMGFDCYCHGATAADFDGNGYADIIVTDPAIARRPIYLKNKHDGTFTATPITALAGLHNKNVFNVELVDVNADEKYDLIFPGSEQSTGGNMEKPWDFQSTIYLNDGSNVFADTLQTVKIPTNTSYPFMNDVIVKDLKIAVLRGDPSGKLLVQVYSYPLFNVISSTSVPAGDTVWFTLYNGNIVGSFAINPFTVKW